MVAEQIEYLQPPASDLRKSVNRTHSDVRFLFGMARRNLLKLR